MKTHLIFLGSLLVGWYFGLLPDDFAAFAGIFGFGGSKSKSTSTSESGGYSVGSSQQGSSAVSGSTAQSQGSSYSTQAVYNDPFLQELFANATGATARAAMNLPDFTAAARALFTGGNQFMQTLSTGGAGREELVSQLDGGGELLDERIGLLQEDVGRFLREEALPGIDSRAIAAGGMGGSRQGIAQGRALEGATREFTRGAVDLRVADQQRRAQLAESLMSGDRAAAGTGLAAIPNLLSTLQAEQGAELAPYEQLAGILGGPTVLTESASQQTSDSIARSLSESFGISYQQAQDWAKSVSTSKSTGFNFGRGA